MAAVFALGSNGSGQLGVLHREDVSVPKPVAFEPTAPASPITSLAAGGNHTLLVTEAGDVYWSGDATTGACGLTGHLADNATRTEPVFRKIETGLEVADGGGGDRVSMVAATWEASMLVCRDDDGRSRRIYTLGTGQKGELGQGELLVRTPSSTLIKNFPPPDTAVVDISACMSHVVAVLSNGDVYGWGVGRKGQLGAPASATIFIPRRIPDVPFPVVRAVCGREFTALFASPGDGRFLVLGSDKWGVRESAPTDATGWIDVKASWGGVYILKEGGRLRAWGRDDHGGLPPPNLPKISRLAAGSEHVVALTEDGDVLAWGWGEHGNCGPTGAAEGVDAKGRPNLIASKKHIPPEADISGVGAGCATSWIYITGL